MLSLFKDLDRVIYRFIFIIYQNKYALKELLFLMLLHAPLVSMYFLHLIHTVAICLYCHHN